MPTVLNKKQQLFVKEYLVDLNGTRAAIAAGYSSNGAEVTASRLIRNPKVSKLLSTKIEKKFEKLEITSDHVLQEVARLAFLDPRKCYDDTGRLKSITELDADTAAALRGIEVRELYTAGVPIGQLTKIKYADKGANLERLMKYLKLFSQDSEGRGAVSISVQVTHVNAYKAKAPVIAATVERL